MTENLPEQPEAKASTPLSFNIGEEFSAPSKRLPPAGIVAICVLVIAVVVALFTFFERPRPQSAGSVDLITPVAVPGQDATVVAVNASIKNEGEHVLWIRELTATVTTADGQSFSDTPVAAVDFDRYYKSFSGLDRAKLDPLVLETKVPTGQEFRGTLLVLFPVALANFESRKSFSITIKGYDRPLPLVLTEKRAQ